MGFFMYVKDMRGGVKTTPPLVNFFKDHCMRLIFGTEHKLYMKFMKFEKKLKKLKIEDIEQEYWKLIKTKAKPPSENKTIADLKGHRTSFNLYF